MVSPYPFLTGRWLCTIDVPAMAVARNLVIAEKSAIEKTTELCCE